MTQRRFRDSVEGRDRASRAADLAHENLLAVNADLRRQIAALEQSTSFRLGRLVLGLLQPMFRILRLRRFANRPPDVRITTVWPRLEGSITVYQPSSELIPLRVASASEELLAEAVDPTAFVDPVRRGPWTGSISFGYPLGFHSFDAGELSVRIGNSDIPSDGLMTSKASAGGVLRPIDIALDSVIEIRGGFEDLGRSAGTASSVAILSTYRGADRPTAVPHRLIGALRDQGFATIVVDTSESLPDARMDCDVLIHRRNIGWDFASWLSTLAMLPRIVDEASNLLLINDSNIGPLRPLDGIFEMGRRLDVDIWGLTDSWDISHHLQSYFLHFNESALRSGCVGDFLDSFTFPSDKERIIGAGELGLSRFMRSRGLELGAVFPYTMLAQTFLDSFPERSRRVLDLPENSFQAEHDLIADNEELRFLLDTVDRIRSSAPVNPTHYFWDILLSKGSPFVKRELVVKNPDLIAGLHRLPMLVPDASARAALDEEVRTWSRTHPDMCLPLALHWQPPTN